MSLSRNSLLVIIVLLIAVSIAATMAYLRERERSDTVEISVGANGLKISHDK
jgi:hypothetical protein